MLKFEKDQLILASASESRKNLLKNVGLNFSTVPANIDEELVKSRYAEYSASNIADVLAKEKATAISNVYTNSLVIGADQLLECEGEVFNKPNSKEEVINHLTKLRGKTHRLISAACVVKNGKILWKTVGRASLTMKQLDDQFILEYARKFGSSVKSTVGGYRIEAEGLFLFSRVNGNNSVILGLPLIPLLHFLENWSLSE